MLYYPQELGRNFDEFLRMIRGFQLSDDQQVAIPANWPNNELVGDRVIVPPAQDVDSTAKRLKEYLGVTLIVVRSDELLAEMAKVADDEAERLADLWIREATEVKYVKRSDVVRPAYLYFAFKQLLKKYWA